MLKFESHVLCLACLNILITKPPIILTKKRRSMNWIVLYVMKIFVSVKIDFGDWYVIYIVKTEPFTNYGIHFHMGIIIYKNYLGKFK